jgi:hypothetical protein
LLIVALLVAGSNKHLGEPNRMLPAPGNVVSWFNSSFEKSSELLKRCLNEAAVKFYWINGWFHLPGGFGKT